MNETEQALKNMTEEQLQTLLTTDFDPALVKQAEANIAGQELLESLYAYGAYSADREVAEGDDEQPLSKEASAEFETAEGEILAAMDAAVQASGVAVIEDEIELQKTAQVCGAAMLSGYIDQIEKLAEESLEKEAGPKLKKLKGYLDKGKKHLGEAYEKVREHAGAAGKQLKKHQGKAGVIAGAGLGALGAHMAMKHKSGHDKKASELSVAELTDAVRTQEAVENLIGDGIEKLAGAGKKAGEAMGHLAKVKKTLGEGYHHVTHGKHRGKYGLGAGAVAGAGGAALAHRLMSKKD